MCLAPEVEGDESNLIESSECPELIPCTKPIRTHRSFCVVAVGMRFTHFANEKLQEKAGFGRGKGEQLSSFTFKKLSILRESCGSEPFTCFFGLRF